MPRLSTVRLPWLSSVSTRFKKQGKAAVKRCFSYVEPRVVYSTFCNENVTIFYANCVPQSLKAN